MARVTKNNFLSGTINNLVFRNLNGVQVVQSKASKVRQTQKTKASGNEFRACSTWAKLLRQNLSSFLLHQTDSYMYRRLTGELYNALLSNTNLNKGERTPTNCSTAGLNGFEFNSHSFFKDYFLVDVQAGLNAQRQVVFNIPEMNCKQDMLFPKRYNNAELLLYCIAFLPENNTTVTEAYTMIELNNTAAVIPPFSWTSPVFPEGCWVIAVAKLMYYTSDKFINKNYLNSKAFNPATLLLSAHS